MTESAPGRGFWGRSAASYDRSMLILGGPIPAAIAGVVDLVRGSERVLEVASGTGLFTVAMAPAVGAVIATAYADAMVEQTRTRVAGLDNVRCEVRRMLSEPGGRV